MLKTHQLLGLLDTFYAAQEKLPYALADIYTQWTGQFYLDIS